MGFVVLTLYLWLRDFNPWGCISGSFGVSPWKSLGEPLGVRVHDKYHIWLLGGLCVELLLGSVSLFRDHQGLCVLPAFMGAYKDTLHIGTRGHAMLGHEGVTDAECI